MLLLGALLSLPSALGCAKAELAEPDAPLPPDVGEARVLVERLDAALLDVAQRSRELGQAGRESALRGVARDSFDVPSIARASLGGYWDGLTPEQRAEWVDVYGEFHLVAMAFNWRSSSNARVQYLGEENGPGETVFVRTKLDRPGAGFDVRRDYRLRRTDAGWRIIDVFSPGRVSNVGMRRSEYLAVLTRTDFDGLLEDMRRRIDVRRQG